MVVNFTLQDDVLSRLQKHAKPLVDDINSVISRILDAYEGISIGPADSKSGSKGASNVVECDPAAPPSLRHTSPTKIVLAGHLFKPNETYWNTLLVEVIRRAADVMPKEELLKLIIVNHQPGERTDTGFKYIEDADVSVQGQDSVMAWKAIHHIAAQLGFPIEVEFRWQAKEDAAYPNARGRLRLNA